MEAEKLKPPLNDWKNRKQKVSTEKLRLFLFYKIIYFPFLVFVKVNANEIWKEL